MGALAGIFCGCCDVDPCSISPITNIEFDFDVSISDPDGSDAWSGTILGSSLEFGPNSFAYVEEGGGRTVSIIFNTLAFVDETAPGEEHSVRLGASSDALAPGFIGGGWRRYWCPPEGAVNVNYPGGGLFPQSVPNTPVYSFADLNGWVVLQAGTVEITDVRIT